MKCPSCGAEVSGTKCEYCGSQLPMTPQAQKPRCSSCGSTNITFKRENQGEIRGKNAKRVVHRTVGICKDCGNTWYVAEDTSKAPKQKKVWLWVLGWIFIFPLPLTIILLRNKTMKPIVKYGIIGAAWILYLVLALTNKPNDNEKAVPPETSTSIETIDNEKTEASIETQTSKPNDPEERPTDTTTTEDKAESDLRADFRSKIDDENVLFDESVRNDTTGRWRLTRITSSKDILDYAVDYYNAYFENDNEIHFVVNLTLNTTTVITPMGDFLDVTIHRYIDNEEHDAKMLAGGDVLGEYWVYLDSGEIQDLSQEE